MPLTTNDVALPQFLCTSGKGMAAKLKPHVYSQRSLVIPVKELMEELRKPSILNKPAKQKAHQVNFTTWKFREGR